MLAIAITAKPTAITTSAEGSLNTIAIDHVLKSQHGKMMSRFEMRASSCNSNCMTHMCNDMVNARLSSE
jgi:hypothetical protein